MPRRTAQDGGQRAQAAPPGSSANRDIATQLENSEKMYRYLVDSSPDIIYTLNHEGRFTFVNDRAYSCSATRATN
jgi:PAS domain-containing protein